LTGNDETATSEITILPDGRIYVFGMSRQVLDVLQSFQPDDARVSKLREHLEELTAGSDQSVTVAEGLAAALPGQRANDAAKEKD
jgi:hypothetical protein